MVEASLHLSGALVWPIPPSLMLPPQGKNEGEASERSERSRGRVISLYSNLCPEWWVVEEQFETVAPLVGISS